jgi:hypothetical protein
LPWSSDREKERSVVNRLTRARALACRLPRDEVNRLAKECNSKTNRLPVSFVLYAVVAADGTDKRENAKKCRRLIERARRNNWNIARLRQEIYTRRGHKMATGRHYRLPEAASKPGVAVQDLIRESERWEGFLRYWFEGERAPLAGGPVKKDDFWLRERLDEGLERLVEVGKLVAEAKRDLRDLKSCIEAP